MSVTANAMFGYTLGRELVDVGVSVKFTKNRTVIWLFMNYATSE